MFNGANTICGKAQRNGLAQNFRWERDNLQIRLPTAARPVVRVTDIVAKMRLFAANGTYTGHNFIAGQAPAFINVYNFRA